jgi:glycosyltransferase involved in cell wall biosynthesis
MRRGRVRIPAAVICTLYFFTNAVFAGALESNFWAERRERTRKNRETSVHMAGLPAAGPTDILKGLPALDRSLTPALSAPVAQSLPRNFAAGHAALFKALSLSSGSIRKITLPDSPAASRPRVVVHIQDVHQNLEAQKNIGRTVRSLVENGQAGLVGLEGAFGVIDLSGLRGFYRRDVLLKVADYLLETNGISGPIHAALTVPTEFPPIWGIDDTAHYEANVESYRRSAPLVKDAKDKLAAGRAELARRKAAAFNAGLAAFDGKAEAYHADRLSLNEYAGALASSAPESLGPALRLFRKAQELESSMDFKKVEGERARLVDQLARTAGRDTIDELVRWSVAYRTGQVRTADFYSFLQTVCRRGGLDLDRYPAMEGYVRYVLLADRIDAERLFTDLAAAEEAAYARLARTPEEKDLVAESKALRLKEKLADFSLTPDEWAEYSAVKDRWPGEGISWETFESFYKEAQARDRAMADNLLKAMDESGAGAAVLVTGGYHSLGMTETLRRAGVAVVSFVPRIEKIDTAQGSSYLGVFTQEKTPLEKLFRGEKLFLASSPTKDLDEKALAPAAGAAVDAETRARMASGAAEDLRSGRWLSLLQEHTRAVLTEFRDQLSKLNVSTLGAEFTWSLDDVAPVGNKVRVSMTFTANGQPYPVHADVAVDERGKMEVWYEPERTVRGRVAELCRRFAPWTAVHVKARLRLVEYLVRARGVDRAVAETISGLFRNDAAAGKSRVVNSHPINETGRASPGSPAARKATGLPAAVGWIVEREMLAWAARLDEARNGILGEAWWGRRWEASDFASEVKSSQSLAPSKAFLRNPFEMLVHLINNRIAAESENPMALAAAVDNGKPRKAFMAPVGTSPTITGNAGLDYLFSRDAEGDPFYDRLYDYLTTINPRIQERLKMRKDFPFVCGTAAVIGFVELELSSFADEIKVSIRGGEYRAQDGIPVLHYWLEIEHLPTNRRYYLGLNDAQRLIPASVPSNLRRVAFAGLGGDKKFAFKRMEGGFYDRIGVVPGFLSQHWPVRAALMGFRNPIHASWVLYRDDERGRRFEKAIFEAWDAFVLAQLELLRDEVPEGSAPLFSRRQLAALIQFYEDNPSLTAQEIEMLKEPEMWRLFISTLSLNPLTVPTARLFWRRPDILPLAVEMLGARQRVAKTDRIEDITPEMFAKWVELLSALHGVSSGAPSAPRRAYREFNILVYAGAAVVPLLLIGLTSLLFRDASWAGRTSLIALWVVSALASWQYAVIAWRANAARRKAGPLPDLSPGDETAVKEKVAGLMKPAFWRLGASMRSMEIKITPDTGRWVPARKVKGEYVLEISDGLAKLIRDDKIDENILRLIMDQEARRFLGHSTFRIVLARLQIPAFANPLGWAWRRISRAGPIGWRFVRIFLPRRPSEKVLSESDRPITLLEVAPVFYFDDTGGTERFLQALNKELISRPGFTIHCVYGVRGPPRTVEERTEGGGTLVHHQVQVPGLYGRASLSPAVFRGYSREIARIARENDVDVVHLHGIYNIAVILAVAWQSIRRGLPHIVTNHLAFEWSIRRPHIIVLNVLKIILVYWTYYLVAVSRAAARGFGRRPSMIASGISLEFFAPQTGQAEEFRDKYGIDSDAPLVFYPARISRIKGQKDLLVLAEEFRARGRKEKVIVMGSETHPKYAAELRDEIRLRGLTEQFIVLPAGPREDVRGGLAAATLVVAPSTLEGLPLFVMEAAAMGVPVVGYASPGLMEAVQHGKTGVLVTTGDKKGLARETINLMGNSERREQLAKAGRGWVEKNFSLKGHAERHIRLYSRIAGVSKGPAAPHSLPDSFLRFVVRRFYALGFPRAAVAAERFRVICLHAIPVAEAAVYGAAIAVSRAAFGWVVALFSLAHAAVESIFDVLPRLIHGEIGLREGIVALLKRMGPQAAAGLLFALPFVAQALLQVWGVPVPSFHDIHAFGFTLPVDPAFIVSAILHIADNRRNYLNTRAQARADAAALVEMIRGRGDLSPQAVRRILSTRLEVLGNFAPGRPLEEMDVNAFARETGGRLGTDFEYDHEFSRAWRERMDGEKLARPSAGDCFWAQYRAAAVVAAPDAAPAEEAKEGPVVQVIDEFVTSKDLPAVEELANSLARTGGRAGGEPVELRLIAAEPGLKAKLMRLAAGNSHVSVRDVPLTEEGLSAWDLAEDFRKWREERENTLGGKSLRLTISLSGGARVMGGLGGDSLYARALQAALAPMAPRPLDLRNMFDVARRVTEFA